MKKLLFIMSSLIIGAGSISAQDSNPFFEEWNTPFQVPPFEQITNDDYLPAFMEGMNQQTKEIQSIIDNQDPATFDNTILALDNSGKLLSKTSSVFYGLNSANTSNEMQATARDVSPLLTQHRDDINLNPHLFQRVKAVYDQKEKLGLDSDQLKLLEETYKGFVRGGANLPENNQEKFRKLNKEISILQLTFGQNLLAETNNYKLIIEEEGDLAGLPNGLIEAAAKAGNADSVTTGKWVFTLHNPSVLPFLQFSDNRDLREEIFTAYINRCNNNNDFDNKEIIEKLIRFRLEKANLLGYDTYADFVLEERMSKKSENVYNLLNQIWVPALAKAKEEAAEMQQMIDREEGGFAHEGWDWRYYNEKVMAEKFSLNEEQLKPYFMLGNVRDGIFYLAGKLYGISFTQVQDAPLPHKDATLWECKDADGTHLGVLYLDFFPRASKRGGAWCGSYRPQGYKDGERTAPVVTIVCNFTPPSGDAPALLTPDEVETFFHEFGHALHGLFRDVKYDGISGVPRDFVELPSQVMENWVFEPELLNVYAKHDITGEVIPGELVDKLENSSTYGQGFKTGEYIAASLLDMDYHTLTEIGEFDVLRFEDSCMTHIGLIPQIPPRYRSTYFQHTMTGGYTAGYYSYIWAEVLDADAYQAFVETGDIFDRATATRFRESILSRGGSEEAMKMYVDFRGSEPKIDGLLKKRGLQ
ncbi:MAG: M3 family metallopeptidase [Bacteroidales bacterium]|nr:M3 family metallopeptidase [Bacteroidales bacterium]